MKNASKSITLTIIVFVMFLSAMGQTAKNITFTGYFQAIYDRPIATFGGNFEPMHKNIGRQMESGRISLNENKKIFEIRWAHGDNGVCEYVDKEVKNDTDATYGDVEITTYTGTWIDLNERCQLKIVKTKESGCITTIFSRKVIDAQFNIDTWQRIFTFYTNGACF